MGSGSWYSNKIQTIEINKISSLKTHHLNDFIQYFNHLMKTQEIKQ
jgi:hypothetical protein